ncbi:multidrug transporter [Pseudomonas monteilii]|uniref:Multidrug transporter n=1 Tax=Pseudomonas monteilii TaxID=76759 RepID=A0AAE6V3W6_9PSED|nr:efflux transporter outer membrane subunit [Pseudomonas monteilii]QHB28792.1 multidrug transporter [Pseudomonas monteilii]
MKFTILPLTFVMALGGCSLIPDYQQPDSPIANTWPQGEAYSASASTNTAQSLQWQQVFRDPALRQLIGLALEHNRDLRQAVLNVDAYRALHRIQRSALAPSVEGGFASSRTRLPKDLSTTGESGIQSEYDVTLDVAYEVDIFGRLRSLSQAAQEEYLASEQARYGVQITLVADVANAYLAWVSKHSQLSLARSSLRNYTANLELIDQRFGSGTASEIDVRQAKSLVGEAQAREARYLREVAQAANALEVLIGTQLPNATAPRDSLDEEMIAQFPAGQPSSLLLRRPDISAAEHRLLAANANIGAARAAFFPSVTLSAAAGTASSDIGGLFNGGSGVWQFVPQVNIPIFNAGRLSANLDYAQIQKDINVARYESSIQSAFREVADGLAARATYGKQLHSQSMLVDNNQHYFSLAQQRYSEGVDNYLAVLDAQRELFSAQQQLIEDRLNQLQSEVNLFKALGGGWQSEPSSLAKDTSYPAPAA